MNARPRSFVGFTIIMAALLWGEPNLPSLYIGCLIGFLGIITRILAAAYRYTEAEFMIRGPYRFVRHPHHLGSLLIVIGLSVISRNIYIMLASIIIVGYIYNSHVKIEEEQLADLWGSRYLIFKSNVSAIFPQLIPFVPAGGETHKHSVKNALFRSRSRELLAFAGFCVTLLLLFWKHRAENLQLYYTVVSCIGLMFVIIRPAYYRFYKKY